MTVCFDVILYGFHGVPREYKIVVIMFICLRSLHIRFLDALGVLDFLLHLALAGSS